jgi:ABC-2 type transport system ATP-binding protein
LDYVRENGGLTPTCFSMRGVDMKSSSSSEANSSQRPIVCEAVTYIYQDGTQANRAIDLELRAGEVFCLLGPNGAGKTTLIRQITTELKPSSGRVLIFGRDASRDEIATKVQLGVIPQGANLFDGLTVEQHLSCFGPLKQLTRRQTATAVERMLEECDLKDLRNKWVRDLSGGQQRRVLIALALMADPEILILDEPTVGLDPVARRKLWDNISKQRNAGKAILLTTHYLPEAEHLADRVGFIEKGELKRVGTLSQLYAQMRQTVRVTVFDENSGAEISHELFDTLAEAQVFAQCKNLRAYSVGRVSLEDIYLRLVGHSLDLNEGDARA